jgi:hypothetical protein
MAEATRTSGARSGTPCPKAQSLKPKARRHVRLTQIGMGWGRGRPVVKTTRATGSGTVTA